MLTPLIYLAATPGPTPKSDYDNIHVPLGVMGNDLLSFSPSRDLNLVHTVENWKVDEFEYTYAVAKELHELGWTVHAITGPDVQPHNDFSWTDTLASNTHEAAERIFGVWREVQYRLSAPDGSVFSPVVVFLASTALIDWPARKGIETPVGSPVKTMTTPENYLREIMHVGPEVRVHVIVCEQLAYETAYPPSLRMFQMPCLDLSTQSNFTLASQFVCEGDTYRELFCGLVDLEATRRWGR